MVLALGWQEGMEAAVSVQGLSVGKVGPSLVVIRDRVEYLEINRGRLLTQWEERQKRSSTCFIVPLNLLST